MFSMSEHPDYVPHRRYTVTLRGLGGHTETVRVLTNRGPAKAAYLAGIATTGILGRRKVYALDVDVRDDGPPEVTAGGVPVMRGYAFDRDEW
jgi:hypothetical protein